MLAFLKYFLKRTKSSLPTFHLYFKQGISHTTKFFNFLSPIPTKTHIPKEVLISEASQPLGPREENENTGVPLGSRKKQPLAPSPIISKKWQFRTVFRKGRCDNEWYRGLSKTSAVYWALFLVSPPRNLLFWNECSSQSSKQRILSDCFLLGCIFFLRWAWKSSLVFLSDYRHKSSCQNFHSIQTLPSLTQLSPQRPPVSRH